MAVKNIILNVNDNDYELAVEASTSLADALRLHLGFTGTKLFCNEGECGACTINVDGEAILSCMVMAIDLEGRKIVTIEGLADPKTGELHPLQAAFVEHSGMQCGFCTAGMIMTSKVLLEKNPDPTEEDVRHALAGNLCRCGNYHRINESVRAAAVKIAEKMPD